MGSSGSGKSTLMNILGCLDRPTAGRYWLDGDEISAAFPRPAGFDPQSQDRFRVSKLQPVAPHQRLENVIMPLAYTHTLVSKREAREGVAMLGASRTWASHRPSTVAVIGWSATAGRYRPFAD